MSIVDEDSIWFLAQTGLHHTHLKRDASPCSACLLLGQPMLIDDAQADARFADCELVREPPLKRSYLGVPLAMEDGTLVGTLWCGSSKVAAFDARDQIRLSALVNLAEQALNAHATALELARANASLSKLNGLFKQAETAAQIGSWRVDLAKNELHWSDQTFAIHGVPLGTKVDISNAIDFYEAEDRALVESTLERAIHDGEAFSFEATIRREDGERRRIRAMGERFDIDGEPESVAGVFMDCTEEHMRTIALQRAATRDALTGLYNRSEFDRRLATALNAREKAGPDCALTVMLMDLDGFKDVNDRLGHLVGDRLLAQISRSLEKSVADQSFVARWGGDEFALLFPAGCDLAEAEAIAHKLISDIGAQVQIGENHIRISATCGLAEMRDGAACEELMRRADLALYHGKNNGRGGVHCWSEPIETVQAARQAAIAQLSEALNTGRAFAAYQPIVELDGGKITGVEALLRLRDRSGQVLSASQFFPALLDPSLARRVSRFMLEQIAMEAPKLLELFGASLRIGVNVSEADLSQGDFQKVMDEFITQSGLEPANIVLEVTETMLLLDESGRIKALLQTLDTRGFTVALDDFGTGFSSLTHLRDFPIRKVKIDKDFIATMARDHQSRLIVQAMVQMGRSLGISTVAEGVETQGQSVYLSSIGCSHAQGFLFARPASLAQHMEHHRETLGSGPSQNAARRRPRDNLRRLAT
ncbi:MAG: EAL domain-containing protein [Pseudomonadota bacterium]